MQQQPLSRNNFPEALNGGFAPATTRCRCPKCGCGNLMLTESIEAFTEFEVKDGRLNRQAGVHEFGSYFALHAKCDGCGHRWRVKKAQQITDVVTELDPKTLKPF